MCEKPLKRYISKNLCKRETKSDWFFLKVSSIITFEVKVKMFVCWRITVRKTAVLQTCLVAVLAVFGVMCGQAADLKTYKDVYEKEAKEILQSFQPKFDDLQQQYQKSLEALKAGAQGRGDFKTTKAAADEIGRFQKAKNLSAAPDEAEIPEIKAFQAAYTKQFSVWEMDMTAKLGALTVNYGQALNRLLKEQTKAGKLDEAAAVNKELEKAQASIKDYAETLATLKGPAATNGTPVVTSSKPVIATEKTTGKQDLYMVIDLSGGKDAEKYPVTYLSDVPKGGWTDEYKTDKLVLRKILAGTFEMGSPKNETGRPYFDANSVLAETQHSVMLTHDFYIGVFEVTQRQWELVMGDRPSKFANEACYATRPVEKGANYQTIRRDGIDLEKPWPESHSVPASTFLGRLREKTGLSNFDLPTEAQWEYACRAGSSKALNNNRDLKENKESDKELGKLGRYKINSGAVGNKYSPDSDATKGTAKVGSYLPNAWGLYDMHGNVWEWCLDRIKRYEGGECTDPQGGAVKPLPDGGNFIRRGGGYSSTAVECRAATRNYNYFQNAYGAVGFRLAMTLR
jgi:formylglycine-generating enzyme required for sulfatase activity